MKLYLFFCMLMWVKDTHAQVKHVQFGITACSETEREYMDGSDGEVMIYNDFELQTLVNMQPPFAVPVDWPGYYDAGLAEMEICKENLNVLTEVYKGQRVPQAAPQSSIYSRDKVRLGLKSILICHSTRFFPPPVRVRWTRNGVNVTEHAKLSQFYPNDDNTYNQFSHLSFTPKEGDVYKCTVEHLALKMPDTKTWEVDVHFPSFGLSILCGVGLVVGLLGLVVGLYFFIKGTKPKTTNATGGGQTIGM